MIITKQKYLEEVGIVPVPDVWQINEAALDLRIGMKIYFPASGEEKELKPGEFFTINPNDHFLIQTLEKVTLPKDIVGVVYPRSGTNRKGITVDLTGVVDPGYQGNLMIPVTNMMNKPVHFYPGERIAQIMFHRTEQVPESVRESKYHEGEMAAKPDKEEETRLIHSGEMLASKLNGTK